MAFANKFTEEDQNKVADFLNFIAVKAEFNGWKTDDTIKHFKLLAHMQQVILPKIEANTLEIGELKDMTGKSNEEEKEDS